MNGLYDEHKKINYGKIEINQLQKTFLRDFNPIYAKA